jgi:3-deoxy-D-manno-octulosonate 8-phosphate phosphatase (KDO 8-P phosphatase)
VRERADWTSRSKAGSGAARELIELILKTQGRWDAVVAAYANEGAARTP